MNPTLGDQDEHDQFSDPLEQAPQPPPASEPNIAQGPTRTDFWQNHDVPEVT
jgi:hypothetical protein